MIPAVVHDPWYAQPTSSNASTIAAHLFAAGARVSQFRRQKSSAFPTGCLPAVAQEIRRPRHRPGLAHQRESRPPDTSLQIPMVIMLTEQGAPHGVGLNPTISRPAYLPRNRAAVPPYVLQWYRASILPHASLLFENCAKIVALSTPVTDLRPRAKWDTDVPDSVGASSPSPRPISSIRGQPGSVRRITSRPTFSDHAPSASSKSNICDLRCHRARQFTSRKSLDVVAPFHPPFSRRIP